jgi:hypothetical protein
VVSVGAGLVGAVQGHLQLGDGDAHLLLVALLLVPGTTELVLEFCLEPFRFILTLSSFSLLLWISDWKAWCFVHLQWIVREER